MYSANPRFPRVLSFNSPALYGEILNPDNDGLADRNSSDMVEKAAYREGSLTAGSEDAVLPERAPFVQPVAKTSKITHHEH